MKHRTRTVKVKKENSGIYVDGPLPYQTVYIHFGFGTDVGVTVWCGGTIDLAWPADKHPTLHTFGGSKK